MSVNKVILMGRLTRDPESRFMPSGDAVVNFSLATNESWRGKDGDKVERVEYHNITLHRRLAEISDQYLTKGVMVYIEGRIQSRKYTGKGGVERVAYDIIGNEMKMLGGRGNGQQQEPETGHQTEQPRRQQTKPAPVMDDLDDDIPF